jgi:hypothetical protein
VNTAVTAARDDRAQMDCLWADLTQADASGDAAWLAQLAWDLYARLGQAQAGQARLQAASRTRAASGGPDPWHSPAEPASAPARSSTAPR